MPSSPPVSEALLRSVSVDNTLAYMGSLLSFLVPSEATGGGLAVLIAHSRPGSEPPPHVHHHEHEIYYLLEGEVDFFVEGADEVLRATPSSMAFLPARRAHALVFRSEARFVTVVHGVDGQPVGIDRYLKAMALGPAESLDLPAMPDRYATIDPEAMAKAAALASKHGVEFLSPEETGRRLPLYPGFGVAPA